MDPTRRSAGPRRDDELKRESTRVWHEQEQGYGAEKVWKQPGREQSRAARCTVVGLLMQVLDLRGAVRGGRFVVDHTPGTTRS